MSNPTISKVLEPILRCYRQQQLRRQMSLFLTVTGLIGLGLVALANELALAKSFLWKSYALTVGLGLLFLWLRSLRKKHSVQELAQRIEQEHPSLRAALITALDQTPDPASGQYHYLQERVIREALEHHLKQPWDHSFHLRLFYSGIIRFCSFLIVLVATYLLANLAVDHQESGASAVFSGMLKVEPGNLELEKGDAVVVTARFGKHVPQKVSLIIMPSDGNTRRMEMARSMEDPLFGASLLSVETDTAYYITFDDEQSETFKLSVFEFPKLIQADAHINYPSYTGLDERSIKDTLRISAVEGSQLRYEFQINKALQSAMLMDQEGALLPLVPDTLRSNIFLLETPLQTTGRYELHLTDLEGRSNKQPPSIHIRVTPNEPPNLKWVFPRGDQRFSALEEVEFEGEAWDDYGLRGYGIGYQVSGQDAIEVTLGMEAGAKEKANLNHLLELELLKMQPGGLISYYLWAEDLGPDGALRKNYSDIFFGEIRPFEEIFRQGQPGQSSSQQSEQQDGASSQQDPAMQLAEMQKEIISATWNIRRRPSGSALSDQDSEDLNVVLESQEEAMNQAQTMLEELTDAEATEAMNQAREAMSQAADSLYDGVHDRSLTALSQALVHEQQAYQWLLKSRPNESNVTQGQGGGGGGGGGRSQQQLNQLDLTEEQDRYETQSQASGSQTTEQNESLQQLNRLKDLARRQEDLNERLQELQTALTQAADEEQRETLERELKRLRDEQRRMLEDMDELNERLAQSQDPDNAQAMDQLDQIRNQAQQAAEAIDNEAISSALAAGSRAQEGLESMREDFRQRNSSEFSQAMQELRNQAREIGARQDGIRDRLEEAQRDTSKQSLATSSSAREAMELSEKQREELESIMQQIRQISQDAEDAEPLLSRQLSETYRQTDQNQLDGLLETTQQLSFLNMAERAAEVEDRIHPEIESLEERIDRAATSILGDGVEGLRRARALLEELAQDLESEIAQASSQDSPREDGDPSQIAQNAGPATPPNQEGSSAQQSSASSQPNPSEAVASAQEGRAQEASIAQTGSGSSPAENPDQNPPNGPPTPQPGQGGQGGQGGQPQQLRGNGGASMAQAWRNQGGGDEQSNSAANEGPITGERYREWSDGLREAEEMVDLPELQNDIATIRDRARVIRRESRDEGETPKWDLVRLQIEKPLYEVRKRINEELARRASREAMVPIDRDPVPDAFSELVETYYQTLGEGR